MKKEVPAIDRLTGAWPLTPASSIHEARAHLRNTGEPAAVVFRSDHPVGVVTTAALARAHDASALVATVMDHVREPAGHSVVASASGPGHDDGRDRCTWNSCCCRTPPTTGERCSPTRPRRSS